MLLGMYIRWAKGRGFEIELLDRQPAEEAGIKGATFEVKGDHAYGRLRVESGVHRLVRMSPFDTQHRRHTSFASVAAFPDLDDRIEIEVEEGDLRIDTFRASGKGGQHVNVTDSAVRITHLPTGIVVSCQNERSQHRNRDSAMKVLRARLYDRAVRERKAREEAEKESLGDNTWGNQIRSYVFQPYRMVKDHRTNHQVGDVDRVMNGDHQGRPDPPSGARDPCRLIDVERFGSGGASPVPRSRSSAARAARRPRSGRGWGRGPGFQPPWLPPGSARGFRNRNSLARWGALRRVPICRYFFVNPPFTLSPETAGSERSSLPTASLARSPCAAVRFALGSLRELTISPCVRFRFPARHPAARRNRLYERTPAFRRSRLAGRGGGVPPAGRGRTHGGPELVDGGRPALPHRPRSRRRQRRGRRPAPARPVSRGGGDGFLDGGGQGDRPRGRGSDRDRGRRALHRRRTRAGRGRRAPPR